jgi:NodT family efflux transporter outer membrane factor (OMF) lipoprotein
MMTLLSRPALRLLPLMALCLGACSITAVKPPPPAAPPAQFKEAGLWKRAAAASGDALPVPETWWQLFRDPVLDDLQQQLVIGNESLKSAAAQVANAQATVTASQAALFPTLNVGATGTRSGSPPASGSQNPQRNVSNSLALTASAGWELDLWGRLRQASDAAGATLQASRDDLAAARLSAQAALVQSYLSLRAAEAQQALLERTAAANQKALDLTQARYAAGVVAQSDVLQAQTQLKTVQAQVKEAVVQRAQLEHAIAVLLGRPPAALSIVRTAVLPELPAVPELLPSTLLERRPDIAAAERRVATAYAQIGVADAAFFPDLSLSAQAGYRGSALGALLNASNLLWSFGPQLTVALLDSGSRQLASAQARAGADQAASAYRQTVLTAFQEVEDNLVTVDQLGAELQLQREALAAAQRNLEITQDQYKAGTVSFLNVVTAQNSVLSAEASVLALRNRQLAAANQLLKNIGGRWQGS